MPLIDVVQDVCAVVGVLRPTSVFTNIAANRSMQEMSALATEMAQRIAYDTRDWQNLQTVFTATGNGVATTFNLPITYKRMLLDAQVRSSMAPTIPLVMIASLDKWIENRARGVADPRGEWIITSNQLWVFPAPPTGTTISFAYIDNRAIILNSGGFGTRFTNDADAYRLDERLLKLGMIWQWKANKGSPYAEDMGTFSDALAMGGGHDQPAPIYVDSAPLSAGIRARTAYPWPAPT